jgi:1-acyl-sn-glycerol-3-phosphate acyltransferase
MFGARNHFRGRAGLSGDLPPHGSFTAVIALQHFVKATVWILLRLIYRVRVRGSYNIPASGAAILVPNHVSFIDAVLIAAHIQRPVRFAMYYKLYRRFKWIVAPMGAFPIAGKDENIRVYSEAFDIMHKTLMSGELLCLFPEGGITRDGELQPFRSGILKVLRSDPVEVIPVGLHNLWGSYFSRKKTGLFKLPDHFMAKIEMRVGTPSRISDIAEMEKRVAELLY